MQVVSSVVNRSQRVVGDATDRGELIDHQLNRRVLSDHTGVGWLMLADLAAGVDDAVSDTAWVASAGVDNGEGVAKPAAIGASCFGHKEFSP